MIYSFFIIFLILLLLSWLYIFNIYEVGISVNQLSSLNYSIQIQPKNSLGLTAPLRNIEYSYKVTEGNDNVDNIEDKGNGELIIKLKSESTGIKLQIKTDKTQNISLVEIPTHKMEHV